MLEGINFSYDGVYSVDMGLLNCRIGGGMFEETFLPTRNIVEHEIGESKRYLQKVTLEPLEFKLYFAFEYSYDEQRIREVARWLNQSYYKPFYTIDNPNRVFYCMMDGDSKLIHNGLKQGYVELTFRCDSPYAYQPTVIKTNMNFQSTDLTKSIRENTFNSEDKSNVLINDNGDMEIQKKTLTWSSLSGKKWSDLK